MSLRPVQVDDLLDRLADHVAENEIPNRTMFHALLKRIIQRTLEIQGGNQCKAADRLGMHRNTLDRWMTLLGIPRASEPTARRYRNG